ncbi:type VI secretion system protein ImpB [Desulfomicrobium norvegicum]|uniref:Type VI secretion system protein ImpB n=1 Tax=Desulfomicrobium norvegicum (strain DSM 1741 / NCIMB 8310) TaxID=52561 RepID=A0A8G2C4A9_DESNO|nr:type VI secretion system contractile sheath small subunit [Desulfomicrobium norvegicum]SFL95301.1 type VI secretion system protein ImpB [Desulfomicrobium norvegicum]
MAKDSSIAPKERINVTFKPATGGALEEIELPMKVMVVGDFMQRHDPRNLCDRNPVSINKQNFEEVLAKQELSLQISVPNRLLDNAADTDIPVSLEFKAMKDFEPAGIAEQIPEMRKLLQLRDALVSLKGPMGNIPAFRKAIEEVLADDRQREMIMKELGMNDAEVRNLLKKDVPGGETTESKDTPRAPQKKN